MEPDQSEKKVLRTKTYTVTIAQFDDGSARMHRVNDGFNIMELLGICELVSGELREQMKGNIRPDVIIRQVIIDEKDNPEPQ